MTTTQIRTKLVEALRLDLVGPSNDHAFAHELLPQSPRRWYLTGFLVPRQADQQVKSSGDDEMPEQLEMGNLNGADDTETSEQQARVNYLPSSMGVSVLIGPHTHTLEAVVRWGDYNWEAEEEAPEPDEDEAARKYEEEAAKLHAPAGAARCQAW